MTSQKRKESLASIEKKSSSTFSSSHTPYIHWIHCNVCYEQYMLKSRTFYLLACDHVTCEQCTAEVKETAVNGPAIFKCPLCRQQTRACKMGNVMPPHLKELFHPEPYLDGLHTYRIMLFQEKHRNRYLDYEDRQYSALQEYKKITLKHRESAKKAYQTLEEFKSERKLLEKRVISIKNKRKEMEEKRSSSSNSVSSQVPRPTCSVSTSNSSTSQGPRMPRPNHPITNRSGVTSFAQHTPNHSFIL